MVASDAGVIDLLRRLRSRICCEPRSDFRHILPIYEHLLSPRKDADVSVQRELLNIRAKLLSCRQKADVVGVVDRMDRIMEHCITMWQQHPSVNDVIRLLVALAGGDDGDSFVLEDSKSSLRVGDRIRMHDIDMHQCPQALFHKSPTSLHEMSHLGNSIPSQDSSLWYSCTNGRDDRALTDMLRYKQPSSFFCLPESSRTQQGSDDDVTTSSILKSPRHRHVSTDVYKSLKTPRAEKQPYNLSPRKAFFFFDSSQDVHCEIKVQQQEWRGASSITKNSSRESKCSLDSAECWEAQTYAWEDLGDRVGLPEDYANPPTRERNCLLRDLAIPNCYAGDGDPILEVYERDLIEDSLRALNGVESTLFRRDIQSAKFQLPCMRRLKLPLTTVSATLSVLEVFRKSGTVIMRLELIALFYSQDHSRGGKTLQAMGEALQLYLSAHRTLMETVLKQCLTTSASDEGQGNDIASVTILLSKTRRVRRVTEIIGAIFCCDVDDFWPLLQQGKYPRGVALLDRLHHHVSSLRVEDSSGRMQKLVTWFLVKSSAPLLQVLSGLISTGRVDEQTDPFSEFEATTWSKNMLTKSTSEGGNELFSDELSDKVTKMFPKFLSNIASLVAHLSQVQALVRSGNAPAPSQYLPLVMHFRGDRATELAEKWISNDLAFMKFTHHVSDDDTYTKVSGGTFTAVQKSKRGFHRENKLEAIRRSQLHHRELLDQQVLQQKKRQLQLTQLDVADNARRVTETDLALADPQAHGREMLLIKYSALMVGAEERHDYMRWRRDRALRLSPAKEQLQRLRANEMTEWVFEKNQRNKAIVCAVEDIVLIDETSKQMLGIMTDEPSTVPASAFKQRAAMNDAVTRTSSFAGECNWKTSIKGTSATSHVGPWKSSVRVNEEASDCDANVVSVASTDVGAHKTSIRILDEPRGSGAAMYGNVCGTQTANKLAEAGGGSAAAHGAIAVEIRKTDFDQVPDGAILLENQRLEPDGAAYDDIVMETRQTDEHQALDDITPGASPLEVFGYGETNLKDMNRNERDSTIRCSNGVEKLPAEAEEKINTAAQIAKKTRLSLPSVHPFFSTTITKEDRELLTLALTETALDVEFTSFASIVECCVEIPVRFVAAKLERVTLDWFRNTMQVLEHLRWLRKLMLMSEGLCMDIFARDFLAGMNSNSRVNWGLEGRLTSAFNLAMIEACVMRDAVVQAFHYKTTPALSQLLDCVTMIPAMSKVLNEIDLFYDCKWPLGFVITTQSLNYYKEMHRFLLHVRLTSVELREAWAILRTIRRQDRLCVPRDQLCEATVYKMQAFLWAFNETFATQVLMTASSDLELAVQKATKLIELRRCHERYVLFAAHCCFLDGLAREIRLAYLDLLAAAWSLTGFVRALERHVAGMTGQATRIRALCDTSNVALQVVVKKLHNVHRNAERTTREFSECLLLRLNLNNYYSPNDATVAADEADDNTAVHF